MSGFSTKGESMKEKRKWLFVVPLSLALASCATPSSVSALVDAGHEILRSFLTQARKGFAMKGEKIQKVVDMSGEALFENTYSYDFQFQSEGHERINHVYSYPYSGQTQTETYSLSRSPDGYVAREYVDYKNEIAYSKVTDDDGYYSFYDEYFTNPFAIVDGKDFAYSAEEGKTVFTLCQTKLNSFDYFLTGNSQPLSSLSLSYDGESWSVHSLSSLFTGRTKKEDGTYIRCQWRFESSFALSSIGTLTLEGAKPSKVRENVALENAFASVGDNFTLTCVLTLTSDPSTPLQTKVSYFDGESYYIDLNADKDDPSEDYLYHADPFDPTDLLYEYRYDESSRLWIQSPCDESSSYNVAPQTKKLFTPHLGDISVDLFTEGMDRDDYFSCDNDYAAAYIGEGFFSDGELLPYFSFGYGDGAKVKVGDGTLTAILPFYLPSSSSYTPVTYTITYSHLGSTVLPEVDL